MSKHYFKPTSCGHCGNISHMQVIDEVNDKVKSVFIDNSIDGGMYYTILRCPACSEVNIVSYYWDVRMQTDDEIKDNLIYPSSNNLPVGLPEEILNAYKAAEKVKSIDANAYVVLLRRLLEMVCIDKKAQGKSLALMLNDLAERNEIPEKLVKVAYGLKDFGNIGAHPEIGSLNQEEIPIAAALSSAILEYIYIAPHLASIAETKLAAIKRK